ncbi:MAG: alpha/beta hydrolase [Pseudomonadota bacterium]
MPLLRLDDDNSLYFEYTEAQAPDAPTFVFVNALTGNTGAWESVVAPKLREGGFGTLSYNFRGQDGSHFDSSLNLTPALIVDDLKFLLAEIRPNKPVLAGLSIGGLFAARAYLEGADASGLVLMNTLREIGPRISWINDAMPVIVAQGGVPLFLDAILPLLVNQDFAEKARAGALKGQYEPLSASHGHANLMRHASLADWELPYEKFALPTLVITGLQDRVFLDRGVVERLYQRLPDARREEWEDAGHLLPQERPEKLAESLARFGRGL